MKPLRHTSALGWLCGLSAFVAVGGTAAYIVGLAAGSLTGAIVASWSLVAASAAGGLFVLFLIGVIILHGVKQMLDQVRRDGH